MDMNSVYQDGLGLRTDTLLYVASKKQKEKKKKEEVSV